MASVNTHLDSSVEWKALAHFLDPKFFDWIYRCSAELFTNGRAEVFDAIRQSHMTYGIVTPESIEEFLGKQSPAELDVPISNNIDVLINRLINVSVRRQIKEKARQLEAIADGATIDIDNIHSILEFVPVMQEQDASIVPGTQEFLADLNRKIEGTYKFVSTGFQSFDVSLSGEWPVGLTLLGALPGVGKTTIAFQSMVNMAIREGTPSLIFSMEMSKKRLVARAVANLADIPLNKIKIGDLTTTERESVEHWTNYINDLPIYVVSMPAMNVSQIIGYMREYMNKGVKVFFIDHLQCIISEIENRNNALGAIARALKAVADKNGLRTILLCHLTKKEGGRLEVRDSGEVQGVAETFITLSTDSKDDLVRVEVAFEKNRDGDTRPFPMMFNKPMQRFIDGLETCKQSMSVAAD